MIGIAIIVFLMTNSAISEDKLNLLSQVYFLSCVSAMQLVSEVFLFFLKASIKLVT